jgi:hypothetical protein
LVLLDVADHFGRLCPLGEVDQVGSFDERGYAILDEREIGEVYTFDSLAMGQRQS